MCTTALHVIAISHTWVMCRVRHLWITCARIPHPMQPRAVPTCVESCRVYRPSQAYNFKLLRLHRHALKVKSFHFISDPLRQFIFELYHSKFAASRDGWDHFFPCITKGRAAEAPALCCSVCCVRALLQLHIDSMCTCVCVVCGCVCACVGGLGGRGGAVMWRPHRDTVQVTFEWNKPLTRRNNDDMTKASHRVCVGGTRIVPRIAYCGRHTGARHQSKRWLCNVHQTACLRHSPRAWTCTPCNVEASCTPSPAKQSDAASVCHVQESRWSL